MNKTNEQAVLTDEEITTIMRPYIDAADGGYVMDFSSDKVIAGTRAVIAKLGAVAGDEWLERMHELCMPLGLKKAGAIMAHARTRILPAASEADPNLPTEADDLAMRLVEATEERDHLRMLLTKRSASEADIAAKLLDPAIVHQNMLLGKIAKIDMLTCAHTHGEDMVRRWRAFEQWEKASEAGAAPVAWLARWTNSSAPTLTILQETAEIWRRNGAQVSPLYAAPPAQPDTPCDHSEHVRPTDGVCVECGEIVAQPEKQGVPAMRECRHCGFMCAPNSAPAKTWYPLAQPAPTAQPEKQGDCPADDKWNCKYCKHVRQCTLHSAQPATVAQNEICPGCNGSGEGGTVCVGEQDYEGPCHTCGGSGEVKPAPTAQGDERAALQTLVDLEDMRLRLHALHERGHGTDYDHYHKALPAAWGAARASLARQQDGGDAEPAKKPERFAVLKASGSRYAYVNDTQEGVTVKRYDTLKGDGWIIAEKHAASLNQLHARAQRAEGANDAQ